MTPERTKTPGRIPFTIAPPENHLATVQLKNDTPRRRLPLEDRAMSGLGVRQLGSTGLSVSRIGLGLAALGRPAYINLGRDQDLGVGRAVADLEARARVMLAAAQAAGV